MEDLEQLWKTLAAKALWARSEEKGLRYTTVLSDGDNKTIAALNQLRPYGDIVIEKSDCVNHVHKRMGAGLRALKKINKEVKGGRSGLTKALIDLMSAYYRKAIMDHTTASKHPDKIQHAIKKMKKRIIGNLHHGIYHENPEEQHKFCDDTWWSYQKDIPNNTSTYDHLKQKSKWLPQSYLVHLLPLYQCLSSDDLLLRCVTGLIQNQNEAFNATVWRRCPKEKAFGVSTVRRAVCLAAISWNCGKNCYKLILNKLDLVSNYFTDKIIALKDLEISRCFNLSRKKKISNEKSLKKRSEIVAKRLHGDDYQPGMF